MKIYFKNINIDEKILKKIENYKKHIYIMNGYFIQNIGGKPRYDIVGETGEEWQKMTQKTMQLIKNAKPNLERLLNMFVLIDNMHILGDDSFSRQGPRSYPNRT